MRKCEKRFDVRFYSLRPLVCFNFCLSCDPFLGSVMSFILPVSIGVGDRGTYHQKFVKNIFAGSYYQRRSWPRGSRSPDPPEVPSAVHAKCKNPVRIFFLEGGGYGLGSHWWWTRLDPSWTFKPTYATGYYIKFRDFLSKSGIRFRNIVTLSGK